VGRCLAHVSKRPSAKELLLDPFLGTEQLELSLPNTTLSKNKTLKHFSLGDPATSTNMTITGSISEEDNTIFLKVRLCDEIGMHNSFQTLEINLEF
jgi:WNK lysine deficient protein kinase